MRNRHVRWLELLCLTATVLLTGGCPGYATCEDRGYCHDPGPIAGAAGADGGTAGSGGSAGSGGTAGAGGAAGMAGEGGVPAPCGGSCGGATPVCSEPTDECVECTADAHCSGSRPACKTTTHECVECTDSTDCPVDTSLCDTNSNACVECLENANCTDAVESLCSAGSCAPCASDADCAHIPGKTVCDAGECVQCTGKKYAACGTDSMSGRPLVCDSLTRTCSIEQEHSSGLCGSCVSDAECPLGQLCMLQQFGSPATAVGYFCFWKQGDTANGAPADCTAGGQPYVRILQDATSIDAEVADTCGLAVSTCTARNEFRSKDCTAGGTGDDALCGFAPPGDAKCVQFGPTTYRCTMRCLSSDDCPGTACNTLVSQPYCEL